MKIKIKKLHIDAIIPAYATDGSAAFDIHAIVEESKIVGLNGVTIRTGLAFEIPAGYCMKVYSRSGAGFKSNVRLSNCVGVIDSDYRGELMVKLIADTMAFSMIVNNGDRIAQGIIVPVEQVEFELADALGFTERGNGGFGSTGN